MVTYARVALIVLAGGLLALAPAMLAGGNSDDLRRRLAAREVVVIDAMPPGASPTALGGTAVALMRAPPGQVWRVIVDYPGHPRYYPRVTSAEVVEIDGLHAIVHYRIAVGPFSFGVDMNKVPDHRRRRVEWRLAEGRSHGLFLENSGYWQVDPGETADASIVTYAIAVRTMLPGFVTRGAERASLVDTVSALRALVEAPR